MAFDPKKFELLNRVRLDANTSEELSEMPKDYVVEAISVQGDFAIISYRHKGYKDVITEFYNKKGTEIPKINLAEEVKKLRKQFEDKK